MTGSKKSPPIPLPEFVLVLGGARSGKSGYAERLALASGQPRRYIATAEAWDDEMRTRIAQHQAQRGEGWITQEAPLDLRSSLKGARAGEVTLVDCATLWLSNHMLADSDMNAEIAALLLAIKACPAHVILVSNEVGWSIVPENALARRFRDVQGRLNQQLAAEADLVVMVVAGLPIALKGQLPGGLH